MRDLRVEPIAAAQALRLLAIPRGAEGGVGEVRLRRRFALPPDVVRGAQARSDVQFSVGVVLPGAQIGVTNAYPVYSQPVYHPQPVYVQPQPVYYPPPPVYYQPRPVYHVRPPVYVVPAPVYYRGGYRHPGYGHGHYRGHGGHRGHDGHRGHGGYR